MATFTLTVNLNTNDLRQQTPRVAEALRWAADDLVFWNSQPPASITKQDAVGNTRYAWTIA